MSGDLLAAITAAIVRLRGADPMLPVSVLVPNHVLGTQLARALFASTGQIAIEFLLPHEFAWKCAARQALAEGLLPVPDQVDVAIAMDCAERVATALETPAYLKEAARMAGFPPAALRSIRDLQAADVPLGALVAAAPHAPDPEKLHVLARLAEDYARTLDAAHLLERESLYSRAAALQPGADSGPVIVIGDISASSGLERLLGRVKQTRPFAWLVEERGFVGERHLQRRTELQARSGLLAEPVAPVASRKSSLSRLHRDLFTDSGCTKPQPLDGSVRILSAAGESLECVEIARLIRDEARRGVRFQEMAVLLRQPSAYAPHLASAFDRAGIDAFFLEGVPRVDPAARALSLYLDLLDGDLDRSPVLEFLTTAQVPYRSFLPADARISPARWDRISAKAGIVSGIETWRINLGKAVESAEEGDYAADEVPLINALRQVIDRLEMSLSAFPQEGSWREFLDATVAALEAWITRSALTAERLSRVLSPMERFAPAPTRRQFISRAQDLLASQVYREGDLADGRVFVGSVDVAQGLQFKVVFVPGLVERRFPSIVRPDPLLLDEERVLLSDGLETTGERQEQERVRFARACAAAGESLVLSYPRIDAQGGRERVPSSFLLRAASAATGRRVSAEDLRRMAAAGETSLGRPYPQTADTAIDGLERDLALVASGVKGAARHLIDDAPTIARALQAERSAWAKDLTAYDGVVNLKPWPAFAARLRLHGRSVSATRIEAFGACPYRHLLSAGLGLREWEEPERAYVLTGRDRGSVIHAVLDTLFKELKDAKQLPIEAGTLARVKSRAATLLDQALATLVSDGGVVHRALLNGPRDAMRVDLDTMLEKEAKDDSGFVPHAMEVEFEGVSIAFAAGRSLSVHGWIDRLDVNRRTRQVRVIDYKTGWNDWKAEDQFRGGQSVQLAIYVRAAEQAYPKLTVAESRYYFCTSKQRFACKGIEGTPETTATLNSVLTTLDDIAEQGVFAPVADACGFCDFKGICGPHRERRAAHKADDPRLAAFHRMREIV